MTSVRFSYVTDEQAADQIQALTDQQSIDLGSASIVIGRDVQMNGKMVIITSSGKCALIDYPFAGSVSVV